MPSPQLSPTTRPRFPLLEGLCSPSPALGPSGRFSRRSPSPESSSPAQALGRSPRARERPRINPIPLGSRLNFPPHHYERASNLLRPHRWQRKKQRGPLFAHQKHPPTLQFPHQHRHSNPCLVVPNRDNTNGL